ncbi:MAG: nitroreductase family protein [Candidatus Omnitrophica bacterium]|nr:nitroreductase family protein [Candidatus Omnitrophota bacterium]
MDFSELVKKRKSTRRYSSRPVPREVIDRCLEAARLAPSACNSQPWYFIVIDDNKLKDHVSESVFSGIYSINSFAKEAPVLIVVVTERASYIARLGGYLKGVRYSLIDTGITCEHLVLQAEEEGVGTCWLGWFDENKVKKILGISRKKKIDVIISMGYPSGGEEVHKKRKSLSEIRRFNHAGDY